MAGKMKHETMTYSEMFDAFDQEVYTPEQEAMLSQIKRDVQAHFSDHPKRYIHIEGVAACARCMAHIYHADPFICECAGYLHDWDKYLTPDEMVEEAQRYRIDMGVDPHLVLPLLHGRISACRLQERYPNLPEAVFNAIDTHTTGEIEPTRESAVVYVADLIEPSRPSYDSIEKIRGLVGQVDIDRLYLEAYKSTLLYLIETDKYIWPRSIEIFNGLIAKISNQQSSK